MIERVLKSFNQKAREVDLDANQLRSVLNSVLMHQAMIESKGHLLNATRIAGLSKSAGRKYLGMSQKEWVDKYKELL